MGKLARSARRCCALRTPGQIEIQILFTDAAGQILGGTLEETAMSHGGNVWFSGAPINGWIIRPTSGRGAPEWVRRALEEGMKNAAYYPDPEMRRRSRPWPNT